MDAEYLRRVTCDLPAELSLWLVELDNYARAEHIEGLAPEEIARAQRMSSRQAGLRFLASRHALRRLLASSLECPPESLVISENAFGKPRLLAHGLNFNLSRSGPVALIGLSPDFAVGVDIEVVRGVPEIEALAQEHFTRAESNRWASFSERARDQEFLGCWTRKEACVKALGTGLSLPLVSVEAGFADTDRFVEIRLGPSRCDVTVFSLHPATGVVAAVALATSQAVTMARRFVGRP